MKATIVVLLLVFIHSVVCFSWKSIGRKVKEIAPSKKINQPSLILLDTPAVVLSRDAYQSSSINGYLPSDYKNHRGPWNLKLSTNKKGTVTKVYVSESTQTVIVAYKGTNNVQNLVQDVKSLISTRCNMNGVACGKVGKGFLDNFYLDVKEVKAAISPYISKKYQIVFTGHSLGGATSTLAALYFITAYPSMRTPTLITFASPLVGNKEFVSVFNYRMAGAISRRFVTKFKMIGISTLDLVTLVPEQFEHVKADVQTIKCLKNNPLSCHKILNYIKALQSVARL
ncbi:hypothetical protein AKO1_013790 [Acrasis kona]|uniref:Fungal lipase-type domain-containing protein n=1 Tax=Acrasis kona TaxID=1008807 RepID=A0AAW2ZHB7_9EUKA